MSHQPPPPPTDPHDAHRPMHGHGQDHPHGADEHHPHVVPLRLLVGVFVALLFLTWATVAIVEVELGAFNVWAALLIAFAKAVLVALYFMHLRWDSPYNSLVLIAALLFVVLFLGITIVDTLQYQPRLDIWQTGN